MSDEAIEALERRRRAERAAWLVRDLSENAALRVTSGYRRDEGVEAVKRRLFEEMEAAADCERCGGEGKVLDRNFPHGPRWMPCPWCRPLQWATAEQTRRERPLVEAIEKRQAEWARAMRVIATSADWEFRRQPIVFDEFARQRAPWWAKLIAWGIAAYYAVASRS